MKNSIVYLIFIIIFVETNKQIGIMESAINKILTFGANTKMTVISETIVNNNSNDCYSLVIVQGLRGGKKQAKRSFDNTYRIL